MKILMINSVCGIRSTGRICTDIAAELVAQGHEVKIAYGRENVPEQFKKYAVRIGNDLDVKLHGIIARLFDKAGYGSKNVTEKFIKQIKDYDPDIIHLHNIHGYYINIEVLFNYLKNCGKPVVWTLHDCWAFTGHCAYFDFVGCEKWKTGCYRCLQKKSYPSSILVDRSEKNYLQKKQLFATLSNMTVVTPSEWLAGLVKKSYLGKYNIRVINNGIDTEVFKPTMGNFRQKHNIGSKKIILGVAGVWDKRKGLEDFYKLSSILDDSFQIVIVGLNEKQINALPKNILGISRTESVNELAELYSVAEVFVNPTYEDNYPTVNLEAQACGTPVITYDTGGSPESVDFKGVVNKGDVKDIAYLIKQPEKLEVLTPPKKEEQYKKYISLYKELL